MTSGTTGDCRAEASARRAGLLGGGLLVRAARMRAETFAAALQATLISFSLGIGETE